MFKTTITQLSIIRRALTTSARSLNKAAPATTTTGTATTTTNSNNNTKTQKHLKLLSKYYDAELLKSIQITESLVEPEEYLNLKLNSGTKSKLAPQDQRDIYAKNDPVWEAPILYPNQGTGRTPYPEIPQVRNPDREDMRLRFEGARLIPNNNGPTGIRRPMEIAKELSELTGLDFKYLKSLYVRPLVMKRVSLKTAKGNIPNFFVLTIVGDRNGTIGLGIGKSRDGIRTAASKAHWNAIRNLTPISRYEDRTILGSIDYKFHACKLELRSAPPGYGLRVNRNIYEICQAAGIRDLGGKVYRSRNPLMVAQGFVEALTKQRPIEEIAASRGKKIVDVRKAYYAN